MKIQFKRLVMFLFPKLEAIEELRNGWVVECCNYWHQPNQERAMIVAEWATHFNDYKYWWQRPLRAAIWLEHKKT